MTNTNRDTTTDRENVLQMYRKLTPENKEKVMIYLDFLLLRQREEEAQGYWKSSLCLYRRPPSCSASIQSASMSCRAHPRSPPFGAALAS